MTDELGWGIGIDMLTCPERALKPVELRHTLAREMEPQNRNSHCIGSCRSVAKDLLPLSTPPPASALTRSFLIQLTRQLRKHV